MITKILTLVILLTISISCRRQNPNSYPRLDTQFQYSPVFEYVTVNGMTYIDMERSRCNVRMYSIGRDYVGPVSGTTEFLPIEACDRIIGRSPGEYADFTTWLESMRQWLLSWL